MRSLKLALVSAGALLAVAACSSGEGDKAEAPAAPPAAEAPAVETPAAETPAATETPAAAEAPAAGGVTLAGLTGDAANGQKIFGQCRTCHVVEPGVNRVGPSLHGVVGRTAGSVPGFNYSEIGRAHV